jgi:hypothetical protein
MGAATADGCSSVEGVPGELLAAEFPCWRIWQSRPSGLWWATRRGNIQYHHQARLPGWGLTVGGVKTLAELRVQLTDQRELDAMAGAQQ